MTVILLGPDGKPAAPFPSLNLTSDDVLLYAAPAGVAAGPAGFAALSEPFREAGIARVPGFVRAALDECFEIRLHELNEASLDLWFGGMFAVVMDGIDGCRRARGYVPSVSFSPVRCAPPPLVVTAQFDPAVVTWLSAPLDD